tara:strand:- start:65 stop:532 length:468 start_codon:yes stop_codon:yes gene_type:complete
MASINKVIVVGNLGRDPETRYMPSGDAMTNIAVATSEKWKDKNSGEQKEATEWHRITFFGKLAEITNQYLKKGSQVYVEGKLKTRKWTDKDGVDKYTTEIIAETMQMLGNRSSQIDSSSSNYTNENNLDNSNEKFQKNKSKGSINSAEMDDDIPF